ncbi:Sulfurtransferase FdhD [invertebrate metagenome]|uniref:Sulfurtransferase FdhD n=1 Tax=invertebrate metagenome TaxID=1711999 RepID=A0A2H9T2H5_9ZZZZ
MQAVNSIDKNIFCPIKKIPAWRCQKNNMSDIKYSDKVLEEVPVAIIYNGISYVVLMAIADSLEDLSIGFSLTEGIVDQYHDIRDVVTQTHSFGIEIHIEISSRCFHRLKRRQRNMTGKTGCGICGIERLSQVVRPLSQLPETLKIPINKIEKSFLQLQEKQSFFAQTGGSHAAGFINSQGKLVEIREDIGRHIALDKLIGSIIRQNLSGGSILITSRASYEMVQKVITAKIEALFAISAVTHMAVDLAQKYHLTLAGFCRNDQCNIYAGKSRILNGSAV